MKTTRGIENIEAMRRERAIEDPELARQIQELLPGDCVRLTFDTEAGCFPGETLVVRITSIRRGSYRGKLQESPRRQLTRFRLGCLIAFTQVHIHSVPRQEEPVEAHGASGHRSSRHQLRAENRSPLPSRSSVPDLARARAPHAMVCAKRKMVPAKKAWSMMNGLPESWCVYLMTVYNMPEGKKAVCDQREWEEMERARPGYHKLLHSGIATEGAAEQLARGDEARGKPRPRWLVAR